MKEMITSLNLQQVMTILIFCWGLFKACKELYKTKNADKLIDIMVKGIDTVENTNVEGKKPSEVPGTVKNKIKNLVQTEGTQAVRKAMNAALGRTNFNNVSKVVNVAKNVIKFFI